MLQHEVSFFSSGVRLAGRLQLPDAAERPCPAVILAHGYANYMSEFGGLDELAALLAESGYAVLRFDFRGCGESDGPPGRMLCGSEWPADLQSAVSYLLTRPEVDAARLAVVGNSMGGSVAAYAAGHDPRITCAVCLCGLADGTQWLRDLWVGHRGEAAWQDFLARLEADRRARALSGVSEMMVLPELLAQNEVETAYWWEMRRRYPLFLDRAPWESIDSVLAFRPLDALAHTVRPIRFVHGTADPLVSPEHAMRMARQAGQLGDLHLVAGADHALLIGPYKTQVHAAILEWLQTNGVC